MRGGVLLMSDEMDFEESGAILDCRTVFSFPLGIGYSLFAREIPIFVLWSVG